MMISISDVVKYYEDTERLVNELLSNKSDNSNYNIKIDEKELSKFISNKSELYFAITKKYNKNTISITVVIPSIDDIIDNRMMKPLVVSNDNHYIIILDIRDFFDHLVLGTKYCELVSEGVLVVFKDSKISIDSYISRLRGLISHNNVEGINKFKRVMMKELITYNIVNNY